MQDELSPCKPLDEAHTVHIEQDEWPRLLACRVQGGTMQGLIRRLRLLHNVQVQLFLVPMLAAFWGVLVLICAAAFKGFNLIHVVWFSCGAASTTVATYAVSLL